MRLSRYCVTEALPLPLEQGYVRDHYHQYRTINPTNRRSSSWNGVSLCDVGESSGVLTQQLGTTMAGQQAAMESAVQEVASQHLLKLAQEEEMKIDEAINKLDNMGEDDYEVLRQRRLQQLKRQQQLRNEWASLGHGRYTELPNQQAFFEAAKKSPRMVCHFYRPTTQYCQVVDAHFEKLALKHMETRFCKIDAEKSPYLVEKLNVWVMPTIVLIKDGQTVHHLRGFDELGGTQDFSREMLCYVLSTYNVLNYEGGRPSSPTRGSKGVNAVRMAVGGGSVREGLHEREFHDDEEEY